eukprot:101333-Amorphochlora_amoeboformis.AAC.2
MLTRLRSCYPFKKLDCGVGRCREGFWGAMASIEGMFAKSPVEIDTILEGVVDSSRYFVLKAIVSGGLSNP